MQKLFKNTITITNHKAWYYDTNITFIQNDSIDDSVAAVRYHGNIASEQQPELYPDKNNAWWHGYFIIR